MNQESPTEPKIYLLPNLMTAGNLACGFFAVLSIFYGIINGSESGSYQFNPDAINYYKYAIFLIFGSCIFDMLDGRLARLVGKDSPFGREFDSLADVVSFGLAPALLLAKAVLFEMPHPSIGWGIGFLYLLCGALRLARFNCIAAMPKEKGATSDFIGLPIPMAAGAIVSVVFLLIKVYDSDSGMGFWKYPLAVAMVGLALLMMSKVRYPSFKHVNFKTRATMPVLVSFIFLIAAVIAFPWVMPAVLFGAYLLYGLVRPWIGRRLQKHLEAESMVENDDDAQD